MILKVMPLQEKTRDTYVAKPETNIPGPQNAKNIAIAAGQVVMTILDLLKKLLKESPRITKLMNPNVI